MAFEGHPYCDGNKNRGNQHCQKCNEEDDPEDDSAGNRQHNLQQHVNHECSRLSCGDCLYAPPCLSNSEFLECKHGRNKIFEEDHNNPKENNHYSKDEE